MADTTKKDEEQQDAGAKQGGAQRTPMGIRLAPVNGSDQPVLANYTALSAAPGMVFVDFGFLEPAMLAALPRVAKSGGKLPERLNGRLAVRVALGYDALANLHQQLGQVMQGLARQAQARAKKEAS